MRSATITKREAIQALLAISAVGAMSSCKAAGDSSAKYLPVIEDRKSGFFTANEFAFLAAVAQTIIPKTDTAGAMEAGVPDVIASLVADWGDDDYKSYWRKGLETLSADLNAKSSAVFASLNVTQQHEALAAYDDDVFAGRKKGGFYKDMKSTISAGVISTLPKITATRLIRGTCQI